MLRLDGRFCIRLLKIHFMIGGYVSTNYTRVMNTGMIWGTSGRSTTPLVYTEAHHSIHQHTGIRQVFVRVLP